MYPATVSMSARRGVVSRRAFLRRRAAGGAGAGLRWSDCLSAHAGEIRAAGQGVHLAVDGRRPSQFETFDPKPGAETQGPTRAIATSVPGLQIAEHWTHMAPLMNEIGRHSLDDQQGGQPRPGHLPAAHQLRRPRAASFIPASARPSPSSSGDDDFDLPHVRQHLRAEHRTELLGVRYAPFVVTNPNQPPDNLPSPVSGQRLPAPPGTAEGAGGRAGPRRGAADLVQRPSDALPADGPDGPQSADQAFRPRPASRIGCASVYGRSAFGQGCLMARRLVEAGVTFVEVQSSGWDTHGNELASLKKLIPPVDQGDGGAVDRPEGARPARTHAGHLDGRVRPHAADQPDGGPRPLPAGVQRRPGRLRRPGRQVVGATDKRGVEVVRRPVRLPDLFCTFCQALGINPRTENQSNVGRPLKIVEHGTRSGSLLSSEPRKHSRQNNSKRALTASTPLPRFASARFSVKRSMSCAAWRFSCPLMSCSARFGGGGRRVVS